MNEEYEQVHQELLDLIRSDLARSELRERLADYHDADIADVLSELDSEERYRVYRALGTERISDVFSYLDDVEDFFREIGLEKSADILEEMDADDAVGCCFSGCISLETVILGDKEFQLDGPLNDAALQNMRKQSES